MKTKSSFNAITIIWLLLLGFMFSLVLLVFISFDGSLKEYIGPFKWTFLFILPPVLLLLIYIVFKNYIHIEIKWLLAIILIILLLSFDFVLVNKISSVATIYFSDFSKGKWRVHQNIRYLMRNSLKEKYNINAMTKFQVESLLGKPDYIEKSVYSYKMGSKFPDDYTLFIKFEEDKVKEFWVNTN